MLSLAQSVWWERLRRGCCGMGCVLIILGAAPHFLTQEDVLAPALNLAISPRSPNSFYWKIFRNQNLDA